MDIHRCRFVPYPSAAINALAFSHPSSNYHRSKAPDTLRLAVGRANGDVEIWNPLRGAWFHETTIEGGQDRSIEGLAWTQDPHHHDQDGGVMPGRLRLFSIGYSTYVTEWDLALRRPARHISGNFGEIWCMAVQPRWTPPLENGATHGLQSLETDNSQDVAIGCADGAVILLSTTDGDLTFKQSLSRPSAKKARVLSIVFQNKSTIITGCADSTIRVLDSRHGQLLRSVSLGSGPIGGPRETLVWSVKCLSDGNIISGDSTGEVRFWDGKNYSLLQRLKTHRADILDVESSADGGTVISGGMDRRTTIYKRTKNAKGPTGARWAAVAHQRLHSHDVKALASFEANDLNVVATGGLDTNLIIVPIQEFGRENHRTISGLPQDPPLASAPRRRLVMSWWGREVRIWRVPTLLSGTSGFPRVDYPDATQKRKLVAVVGVKGEESITSATISADGSLVAVSTMAQLKMFQLRLRESDEQSTLQVRKATIAPDLAGTGARLVQFSPDSKWLCIVTPTNRVLIARIREESGDSNELDPFVRAIQLHRQRRRKPAGSLGSYPTGISRIAFSGDGRMLVLADLSGQLDSWVLEGQQDSLCTDDTLECGDDAASSSSSSSDDEDNVADDEVRAGSKAHVVIYGQRWIKNPNASLLPRLPAAPLVLSFRHQPAPHQQRLTNGNIGLHATRHNPHPHSHDLPDGEDRLLIITSKHQLLEISVLKGVLTPWSRRNPASTLPSEFRGLRDRAKGCFWDLREGTERAWVYGSSWLCMFDLSQDLTGSPPKTAEGRAQQKKARKQKRRGSEDESQKNTSGAGSKIAESNRSTGIGRKMRKISGLTEAGQEVISLEATTGGYSEDDDNLGSSVLSNLRRGLVDGEGQEDAQEHTLAVENGLTNGPDALSERSADKTPAFWCTYKYRPILGITPLGGEHEQGPGLPSDDPARHGGEVALVERPLWDLDLPPRFYGEQEWLDRKTAAR